MLSGLPFFVDFSEDGADELQMQIIEPLTLSPDDVTLSVFPWAPDASAFGSGFSDNATRSYFLNS